MDPCCDKLRVQDSSTCEEKEQISGFHADFHARQVSWRPGGFGPCLRTQSEVTPNRMDVLPRPDFHRFLRPLVGASPVLRT